MRSNVKGWLTKATMLVMGLFLMLPLASVASAQGWPYGQDRRDDRRDRRDRRDDRDDRWERRQDRRQDREERRAERRARRGNSYDGYPQLGGSFQLRQTALNAGYNEGIKEGRKDRDRNERYDFSDESTYQKGTKDYSSRLGDRYLYQRYLRMAFENGYNDGYSGY
ncbi:MAG TPA: hypothetical protein VK363_18860 [Pyrinomonadaceae bacterium]|nr:hypothetical protein [Pyrinomonadaceae bacterium]